MHLCAQSQWGAASSMNEVSIFLAGVASGILLTLTSAFISFSIPRKPKHVHNWGLTAYASYTYQTGGVMFFVCSDCGKEGERFMASLADISVLKKEDIEAFAATSVSNNLIKERGKW